MKKQKKKKDAVPVAKKLNIRKGKKHKTAGTQPIFSAEKLKSKGKKPVPVPAEKRKSGGVGVVTTEDQKRKEDEYYENLFQHYERRNAELRQLQADSSRKADKKQAVARMLVRGFVFIPSDEVLVDMYLKEKNLGEYIDLCPMEEVDVYGTHPQTLTEKYNSNGGVWHFFTQSRPNENENSGKWEFGEKKDVFGNGVKVGVRQELEYNSCNGGGKYKMIEYQLEPPAPATETNSEVIFNGSFVKGDVTADHNLLPYHVSRALTLEKALACRSLNFASAAADTK